MLLAEYVFIWLFFVHSVTPSAYKDGDEELITNPREKKNTPSKTPQFNWKMNTTERISAGQTVYLHCQINNLGDRSVSWIRKSDLKILTIGDILYTEDQRFAPIHENGSDVWMLKVGKAEVRDSGEYECQIAYHDDNEKKLTMTFSLTVLDSRAFIQKSADLHVQIGSKLQLSCFVLRPSAPPNYVYWYRNEHVLNYSPSVDIRSQVFKDSIANGTEISHLTIDYVSVIHSGNYSCSPSNASPASVMVHIVNDENRPAAMQHGNSVQKFSHHGSSSLIFLILTVLLR
ncbi:zwei Ig domain protein zig-8 [Lepeophtheirus salmonis]|nr:zwei Ig domain protein zig-8-like [Lepeophtheirus salmonis]